MNQQDILLLYQYNQWSTAKIMSASTQASQEQYLAPAPFPHGGLQGTLVHMVFAEWILRNRWEGNSPNFRLKPEEFPTFESLRQRVEEEGQRLMSFIAKVTDEELNSPFHYLSTDGKPHERILWQAMAHLVNHGTQHKAEAAAILTGYGYSPGDIDMIYFLADQG